MLEIKKNNADYFKELGINYVGNNSNDKDVLGSKSKARPVDVLGGGDKQVNNFAPGFPRSLDPSDDILG